MRTTIPPRDLQALQLGVQTQHRGASENIHGFSRDSSIRKWKGRSLPQEYKSFRKRSQDNLRLLRSASIHLGGLKQGILYAPGYDDLADFFKDKYNLDDEDKNLNRIRESKDNG